MATNPITSLPIATVLATRALLGLGNVDNTSDMNKPVSTAVTALLATYRLSATQINPSEIAQNGATTGQVLKWNGAAWAPGTDIVGSGGGGGGAVSSVFGRTGDITPQSNDYSFAQIGSKPTTLTGYGITDAAPSSHVASGGSAHAAATTGAAGFMSATDKTKLDGITSGATVNQTDAYLLNRDNHTGAQVISTVTGLQAALDAKAPINNPTFTGTVAGVTAAMVGLGAVNNTSDSAKPVSTAQAAAIAARHVNLQFQEEGTNLGASGTADTFNVVGAGATLSRATNVLTLTIPGYTLPDATNLVTGGLRLTGALGGTATAPTALGYADAAALTSAMGLKANAAAPSFTGLETHAGTSVFTAAAMAGTVIDITKLRNTLALSGDTTLSFSGAPSDGQTWGLVLTGHTSAVTVTIPSSQTVGDHDTITSLVVPANAKVILQWQREGSINLLAGVPGMVIALPFAIEAPIAARDYPVLVNSPWSGRVLSITTDCDAGTCTLTGKINTTALGGTANSVSTTESTQTHSSANLFAPGNRLVVTPSSVTGCTGVVGTIMLRVY